MPSVHLQRLGGGKQLLPGKRAPPCPSTKAQGAAQLGLGGEQHHRELVQVR